MTHLRSNSAARTRSVPRPASANVRRTGFTLIEILVVMGIIVLLIALALPAFSFITGSRSTAAAGNQISVALSIARARAVGLQQVAGLMFFIEPTSDRVQMALVQQAEPNPTAATVGVPTGVDVYLDLMSDTEFVKLPAGVGVQTVQNGMATAPYIYDRYMGFNNNGTSSSAAALANLPTKVGGVILFDANGQLAAKTYALRTQRLNAAGSAFIASRLGSLLYYDPNPLTADSAAASAAPDYIPIATGGTPANVSISQLGLVLFDQSAFDSKQFLLGDERVTGTSDTDKETWLDQNATPTMINRYNGTLIQGE